MKTARADHSATLLQDGRVLVVGGTNGQDILATAELYDTGFEQLDLGRVDAERP